MYTTSNMPQNNLTEDIIAQALENNLKILCTKYQDEFGGLEREIIAVKRQERERDDIVLIEALKEKLE